MIAVISRSCARERDVVDGDQAAEAHGQMLDRRAAARSRRRSCRVRARGARRRSRIVGSRCASRPRGRQIMISTMRGAEGEHAELARSSRNDSGKPISTIAASTTPIWLPMPPSTTIARMIADSMKVKLSGLMKPWRVAKKRAGEAAEHGADGEGRELDVGRVDAERAAGDLVLAQRLPGAAERQPADAQREEVGDQRQHAGSGSRGRSTRCIGRVLDAEEARAKAVIALRRRRASNGRPKKDGRGMPLMPFGPPVNDCQLSRMMRMISPKPSVTMAR